MDPTTSNIDHGRHRLRTALIPPLLAVGLMWIVFAFDRVFDLDLSRFGITPRELHGLVGILFSPFLHGSLDHLLSNSAPMLVLGWLLVYFYPKAAWRVVVAGWFAEGLWVWAAARGHTVHIGASGIIYALAAFLFVSGFIRKRAALIAVSLIVTFLYGSMWWGMLPLVPHVSWESHLFGGMAGALLAWFYRKVPPAHVPEPIVFEDDDAEEVDMNPIADLADASPSTPNSPLPGIWPDQNNTSSTWPIWPEEPKA